MKPAGQSVVEQAGDGAARFEATQIGPDRSAARVAAAAWSEGRRLADPRRQRFGVLLVLAGLGLMAGGGWLIFAG